MQAGLTVSISEIIERARSEGRDALLDHEGFDLVEAIGIDVPRHLMLGGSEDAARADLSIFPGERIVVKVVSPDIPHRSDVGGVSILARDRIAIAEGIRAMEERFAGQRVAGYLLNEFVPHEASLGGELLLGARWTEDFGPVVTFGPGGIYTEFLSASLKQGRGAAIMSPSLTPAGRIESLLEDRAILPLITGRLRGQKALIEMAPLRELLVRFLGFAASLSRHGILDFEMNPLALTCRGPVALDVLVRLGRAAASADPDRPLWKIKRLLEPRSIAIIGVSEKMNPGRVILQNIIRDGFDQDRIHVIKPGRDSIDGCRCYPGLSSLPEKVDMLVLGVDASQAPGVVEEVIRDQRAESLIVIPGGMGERSGTEEIQQKMRAALLASRASAWQGPIINGGNCLGIRSRPGHYDTMFIPRYKLPMPRGPVTPVAIISQSGAFAMARTSKLSGLNPRYMISVGNQADLTIGDYLTYLGDDHSIRVYACYVEGFRPLDGQRWLEAATRIVESGRVVILYRAGRTEAGGRAAASHTASIAGSYAVTRELAEGAGVVVADCLSDFEDLLLLFCLLDGKPVAGWNLGAMSNAGFECVAMADNQGSFRLPAFGDSTRARIEDLFKRCRLDGIVEVHNPLDVTPIMGDGIFEEAARAVMEDTMVDSGIIGIVPMTPALNTLAPSVGHSENLMAPQSVASRLADLKDQLSKPWVVVVDGGLQYDAMAAMLEERGVPVFRSADRAARLFGRFCRARLAAADADRARRDAA